MSVALTSHRVMGTIFTLLGAGGVGGFVYSTIKNSSKGSGITDKQALSEAGGSLTGVSEGVQGDDPLSYEALDPEHRGSSPDGVIPESDEVKNAVKKGYEFFFEGDEKVKVNIDCKGQKPDFDRMGDGRLYIGCTQTGDELSFHSGNYLGNKGRITCTYKPDKKAFGCSNSKGPKYTFGERYSEEIVYIRETN
ncbi:hypothetical protein MHLP_01215 [Candidatus Mycoplasma haematolamae str. Purdue]|uniref:Uncharacterized protein n=1 Tax=Mycoplasma haematolamae (strain Purdue) TaxID=1212765 RepID=I7BJ14_MYCHA|nr:hypothetical protein [Candidatus Mycoplasma haematolamae]AFO51823.1 hypothetical protein MHLP_01215 [Candidatus Mycoplasma haematolamae str. Purdue]